VLPATPFYPGYSFFSRDASTLGSDGSTAPWIFNLGALVLGIIELGVARAFYAVLPRPARADSGEQSGYSALAICRQEFL
jgi:hypothetical membrane protein